MSNYPTGRFKSKALSSIFSQTRRWIDECEKAVRHAKIAVQWGAQMALYPIYALFQVGRLVGRQLQGVAYSAVKLLAAGSARPETDVPIQKVVQLLEQLVVAVPAIAPTDSTSRPDLTSTQPFIPTVEALNPFKPYASLGLWQRLRQAWDTIRQGGLALRPGRFIQQASLSASATLSLRKANLLGAATSSETGMHSARLKIQGVASLLQSHSLVLVTPGNQILDILTPTQQHQLQARIIWEIANYAYRHKQASRRKQPILGWAKHVLGEAAPSLALPGHTSALPQSLRSLPERLRILPTQIREQISAEAFQPIWKRLKKLPTSLQALFALPSRDMDLPRLPGTQAQPTFGLMLDFGILRFLAERTRLRQLWQLQEPAWLTLRDLGGKDLATRDESLQSPSIGMDDQQGARFAETSQSLWAQLFPTFRQLFRHLFKPLKQLWPSAPRQVPILPGSASLQVGMSQNKLTQRRQPGTSIRQTLVNLAGNLRSQQTLGGAVMPTQAAPLAVAQTPEGYEIEFNPNWIEVEATAVGYVKHPLEQLLEWVDRIFLWLETAAIAGWTWLVQIFRTEQDKS